ncbi:MAG: MarR family transcriptional regulator [Candidatus Omnitrophica bacterium]|nr:MarR family transcriptional regulator [Candidatus Omnitrophota bacterium]
MTPHSLAEFADRINELIPDIARVFFKRPTDALFKGKITLPQFFVLCFLQKQGQMRMTDVARFLGVTTAAATGGVDRLVKGGYLTRVFDPKDRRIIKVKLSAKGSETVQKVIQQRRQMIMDIFGRLSDNDREQYLAILSRVHAVLTDQNRTQGAHA